MYLIQQITSNALQKQSLILEDGTTATLVLYFRARQLGWFINSLTYGTFELNGVRITNSPNILQQFKNQIPFGIGCFSAANREPTQIKDFSSGASNLYILTAADIAYYSGYLSGA